MKQIDKVNESVETERYENIMDKLNMIVESLNCDECDANVTIENLCRAIDERNDRIEELENYLECAYKANKKLMKKVKKLKKQVKALKGEFYEM